MTSPFRDNYNTVTTFNIVAGKFYDTCSSTVAGFILVSEVTRNCTRYFFNSTRNYTHWEIQRYNIHVVLPIDHIHVCNRSWTPMLYACQNGFSRSSNGSMRMVLPWMSRDHATTEELQCCSRVRKVISRSSNGSMRMVLLWTSRDHETKDGLQ